MKKLIKIFILIIFALLVLGITTSNALEIEEVTQNTSESVLLNAVKNNYSITLKNAITTMRGHPLIFCRQRGAFLRSWDATYNVDKTQGNDGIVNYPYEDINGNGYAISFVFAHGKEEDYGKQDIQTAYWRLLGFDPEKYNYKDKITEAGNKLYNLGKTYQKFKRTEVDFKVNSDNAVSENSGNLLIYGPINITYTYVSCDDGSFGGFDFQFTGKDVLSTDDVQLCKKDGSNYINIDTNNDKKIRNSKYNGIDLYIRVNLDKIKDANIKMNIQYNGLNALATVYQIIGYSHIRRN